jgi:hypothetical protein
MKIYVELEIISNKAISSYLSGGIYMMNTDTKDNVIDITNLHTPSTIINICNNALQIKEEKRIIVLQGIYEKKGIKNYNGFYYDLIKDELGNQLLTAVIPETLRGELKEGNSYKVKGYLNRKIVDDGTIKLSVGIIDIISNEGKKVSSSHLKLFDIRKKKLDMGYKNLDEFLKEKLYKKQVIHIALIYGNEAIIDKDIYSALGGKIKSYIITEHRINLKSKEDIIDRVNTVNISSVDVIIIARGGGSGLEIFNDPDIAEAISKVNPIVVTAIGHAADKPLIENVADKCFNTPTSLGNYLKEVASKIEIELEDQESKYDTLNKTISDLEDKVEFQKKDYENKLSKQSEKIEMQIGRANKREMTMLIAGVVLGAIISFFIK